MIEVISLTPFIKGVITGIGSCLGLYLIIFYFRKKQHSETELILSPLKEKIDQYQAMLFDQRERSLKQEEQLKVHVEHMLKSSLKVEEETSNITKALKGDSKLQGDWGEVILERCLESSGLEKNKEYILQGVGLVLKDENDKHQKPDAIILLPEDKSIIIDSKVSLNPMFKDDLGALKKSLKSHIDDLSKKKYSFNEKIHSPDYVFMFIPMESIISLVYRELSEVFDYAYKKNIVICSPLSLMPTLKTVSSLWRISKQNTNAEKIANQAGMMFDKFQNLIEDLEKLKRSFSRVNDELISIDKKLHSGKGNLVEKSQKIKELGAKTNS